MEATRGTQSNVVMPYEQKETYARRVLDTRSVWPAPDLRRGSPGKSPRMSTALRPYDVPCNKETYGPASDLGEAL
jgi:hypothetical protein